MKTVGNIISVVTAIALAIVLVGTGFIACIAPPTTNLLANLFSDDATSPFSRTQLVRVADATRDYSFATHDEASLYRTIYEVDSEYRSALEKDGGTVPADFPKLDAVSNPNDVAQTSAAFATASEMYCYSPQTVSHLDDCYAIASRAYPALAIAAIICVAGLIFTGTTLRKRSLGFVLMASGIAIIVALVCLGIAAAVDFARFFSLFHQLFFSQGNWVFPYDSLLICALPTEFWMGMGAVWLVVTLICAFTSLLIGCKLRR